MKTRAATYLAGIFLFVWFGAALAVEPCCNITAIDKRTGTVTAVDATRHRTLQFKAPVRLLRSLKVGQKVYVDQRTSKVSVDGIEPCCNLISVDPAEPVGAAAPVRARPDPRPAEPVSKPAAPVRATPNPRPAEPVSEPRATSQAMSSGDEDNPQAQQYSSGAPMDAITAFPLAAYEGGQEMMQQAASQLRLDIDFEFLDKAYKNDVYVREPVTNKKVRVSCVRFRATSGFKLKMDPPTYSLTNQGLTVTQNFPKIKADGLTYRFQLGPCADIAGGYGVQLSDVKFVYKARPIISFEENGCSVSWNADPNGIGISIGDLNIIGVQNDLDKLAKDAVREAINFTLDAAVGSGLRGELQKVAVQTCGNPRDVVRLH